MDFLSRGKVVVTSGRRGWYATAARAERRCEACGLNARILDAHHIVYQQHLRVWGADPWDSRNMMILCRSCHDQHHGWHGNIEMRMLPDAVFAFAREALGTYGADYLERRYPGIDPRLKVIAY